MSESSERYWPCYCEENVWHLCCELDGAERQRARVAVVSNPGREVALWWQRQVSGGDEPIIWDYHVILLVQDAEGWQVRDLDSALGCPVPAQLYLGLTFPRLARSAATYAPLFRLVPADVYHRELRTDRRHMCLDSGDYVSPPPPWPPIGEGSNLMCFVDMEKDFLGEVLDREELMGAIRAPAGPAELRGPHRRPGR